MLESVFAEANTSRQFVERGGIEALLGLFTLPKLPLTLGAAPPLQALVGAMRSFTAAHADTVSLHLNKALGTQIQVAIAAVKVRLGLGLWALQVFIRL